MSAANAAPMPGESARKAVAGRILLIGNEPGLSRPVTERLTERNCILCEGNSTKKVATILGVTVKTAETHRSNIMFKLKLHSVAELVLYAVRNGIVHIQLPTAALTDSGLHLAN